MEQSNADPIFFGRWPIADFLPQRLKRLLAGSAHRALPLFGEVIKGGSFGDFAFSVAFIGVVNASAIGDLALVHLFGLAHGVSFHWLFPSGAIKTKKRSWFFVPCSWFKEFASLIAIKTG
jgi:hypothetical protein